MSLWSCELAPVSESSPKLTEFTVGTKYALDCMGEVVTPFEGKVELKPANPEDEHKLVILETVKRDSSSARFIVTGYKPGQHKDLAFTLSDGKVSIDIKPMQLEIISILPKDQQPQPFPAFGPFKINYPMWIWIAVVVVLVGLGYSLWRSIKRRRDLQTLRNRLKEHGSALGAFAQFNKDLRTLQRKHSFAPKQPVAKDVIEELNTLFRMYIVREFWIPAHEWSTRQTLHELARAQKTLHREFKNDWEQVFRELDRAQNAKTFYGEDFEQLMKMTRIMIEHIYEKQKAERT